MKLCIQFFKGERDHIPIAEETVLVPSVGEGGVAHGEIHWEGEDTVFVQAKLAFESRNEDVKGRYQLKLAHHPDYEPWTDGDGDFCCIENGDPNNRLQLLRGADGLSFLRLIRREISVAGSPKEDVAIFSIYIRPCREKTQAFHSMVDEMLPVNPFGVLSRFEGLSKTNVKKKWESAFTASDVWYIETQLSECEAQIKVMRQHLLTVAHKYSSVLIRKLEHNSVPKGGQRMYPITRRDVRRRNAFKSGAKVLTPVLMVSYDIPIHRAIADFLLTFQSALYSLIKDLEMSKRRDLRVLDGIPIVDEYKPEDVRREVNYKEELQRWAKRILGECLPFTATGFPWVKCPRQDVTTINIKDVPDSESYKSLYFSMLDYAQKRNFRGAIEGRFCIPRYVRDCEDEVPSAWQKNYSLVYEVWAFKRLVEAFMAEGFEELGASYMRQVVGRIKNINFGSIENEPLCAKRADGLEIKLYHGLRAYKGERLNQEGFSTSTRKPLTPDFAIVFSGPQDCNDHFWIVLDAKSCNDLSKRDVNARDKYRGKFKLNGQPPHQSWIVYSGRWGGTAGIECNANDARMDEGLCWRSELWDEDPLGDNGVISFSADGGLIGYERGCRDCVVGHLRTNFNTARGRGDIFREFVHGQIATAKSWFGV